MLPGAELAREQDEAQGVGCSAFSGFSFTWS